MFKDLKKLEKVLISKRILFKKIAIMHGKGEIFKIKGSICNIPIEAANICNILPRLAVSNGLIVDLKLWIMHILNQFILALYTMHLLT